MVKLTKLLLTTCPGLEDVAIIEVSKLLSIRNYTLRPLGVQGRIILECNEKQNYAVQILNSKSHLLHRVSILLASTKISRKMIALDQIYNFLFKCNIENYIQPENTFAVRVNRLGLHEYTSIDIARVAGDAIRELIFKCYGKYPKVNLDSPEVIERINIVGESCLISICTTGDDSLHKRGYRVYNHPAALKPTIAFAMCMLSEISNHMTVIDPMCGGGTIPIECCFLNVNCEIYGMDISPKHVKGAKLNALAAGFSHKIKFKIGDAMHLDKLNFNVDRIISNLPYGMRIGRKAFIKTLYQKFLKSSKNILSKDNLLTLLTAESCLLKNIAEKLGYILKKEKIIWHGKLKTSMIFLELP